MTHRAKALAFLLLCSILALATPVLALAQEVDDTGAPVVETVIAEDAAPVVVPEPAAAPVVVDPNVALLDAADATGIARAIFTAVRNGDWVEAAAGLLILVVALLRKYGKKFHEWLPDNVIWDKPLWFIFETKPGGWLLNFLTAVAGGCAFAKAGGQVITIDVLKPILNVSLAGAGLFELVRDVWDFGKAWWDKWRAAKAAALVPPAIPPVAP